MRIPPVLDEAARDVCRARTDAADDLSRSKQRLGAFLLRNGYNFPPDVTDDAELLSSLIYNGLPRFDGSVSSSTSIRILLNKGFG